MSAVIKKNWLVLRPMGEEDLAAIMAIELDCYPFPWTKKIFRDCLSVGYVCWLIEQDDAILAYGIMSFGANEAHILNLCVREQSRRQGLATELLEHLLSVAKKYNVDTVFLEVRPSNEAALDLYDRTGFNELSKRKDYYPAEYGREDAIILALGLNGR